MKAFALAFPFAGRMGEASAARRCNHSTNGQCTALRRGRVAQAFRLA